MSAFNSISTCYRHIIHGFAQGRISYRFTTLNRIHWRRFKIKENSFVSDYNHETFSMYRDQNKKYWFVLFTYIFKFTYIDKQQITFFCRMSSYNIPGETKSVPLVLQVDTSLSRLLRGKESKTGRRWGEVVGMIDYWDWSERSRSIGRSIKWKQSRARDRLSSIRLCSDFEGSSRNSWCLVMAWYRRSQYLEANW